MKKLLLILVCLPFFGFGQLLITTNDSTMKFVPDTITCGIGDTVIFQLSSIHNVVEVSEPAWITSIANNPFSWGINFAFGDTSIFVPDTARTYYYICQPHANQDMKGVIIVNGPVTGCMDTLACNYDSLAVINDSSLCIYSTSSASFITACDSYIWEGDTIIVSGTYTNVYTNAAGCDSTHNLNLTINNSVSHTDAHVACDMFIWSCDGAIYTNSTNNATYTYYNGASNGCDSTVTLDLTINNSTSINIDTSICDNTSF